MQFIQTTGKHKLPEAASIPALFRAGIYFACALVLLLCMVVPLHAQTVSGTITGQVTDASGAIIPGVAVAIKNTDTGDARNTVSNGAGIFSVPALPPGPYTINVSGKGFSTETSTLVLSIGQTVSINFKLKVGTEAQKVEVFASGALGLETTEHQLDAVMDSKTLEDQPQEAYSRGETFYSQATNVGVQPVAQPGDSGANNNVTNYNEQSNAVLIGGQNVFSTIYLQDGVVDMNYFDQTATVQPPAEGTNEVQIIRSDPSARYDGANVLNVVSKSGTDEFHGRVYEELENNAMNGRGFNAGALGFTRYNQFGANTGGWVPFTHKKAFFFVDYQGFRDLSATNLTNYLPTAAERGGDFSADLAYNTATGYNGTTLVDPTTWNSTTPAVAPTDLCYPSCSTGQNKINPANIIPLATAYMNLVYPLPAIQPNVTVGTHVNYDEPDRTKFTHDDFLYRGDYNFSEKDHIFGAYNTNSPQILRAESWAQCICRQFNPLHGTDIYVEESHVFNSSLVNTGRVGYSRSQTGKTYLYIGQGVNYFAELGLKGLNPNPLTYALPGVNPSGGYGSPAGGSDTQALQNTYEWSDEVNYIRGKHSMYFGGEYDRVEYNGAWGTTNDNGSLSESGAYTYFSQVNSSSTVTGGSAWVNGPGSGNWNASSTPPPVAYLADYELGYFSNSSASVGGQIGKLRQYNVMPYFQDNWRVTKNLTLNLGMRYDYYSPPTDLLGNAGVYNIATNTYTVGSWAPNKKDFSPRVGFAYGLGDKTAIHGGAGVYFFQFGYDDLSNLITNPSHILTNAESATQTNIGGVVWTGSTANPITGASAGQFNHLTLAEVENNIWPNLLTPSTTYTGSGNTVMPNMPTSYSEQYNLAVQRTFGRDYLLTVDYIGTSDHHLLLTSNLNQAAIPTPTQWASNCAGEGASTPSCTTGASISYRRPYQWTNLGGNNGVAGVASAAINVSGLTKWGASHYNAMEIQLSKRFVDGFEFKTSYVWQNNMDFQTNDHSGNIQIGYYPQGDYGRSDIDELYVIKANAIYELPWGKDKKWLHNNTWYENALGGWRVSGVLTVNSGFPFTPTWSGTDYSYTGASERASQICNGNNFAGKGTWGQTGQTYFNTACYVSPGLPYSSGTTPALPSFGTVQRNAINGPRNTNTDFSVFKEFPIYKTLAFQWRTDAFNAFNHPLPVQPQNSTNTSPGSFGEITGWGNARNIQLTAKVIF